MNTQLKTQLKLEAFTEFLNFVEEESSRAVKEMRGLIDSDSQFGYAKAAGRMQSKLEWLGSSARAYREIYNKSSPS